MSLKLKRTTHILDKTINNQRPSKDKGNLGFEKDQNFKIDIPKGMYEMKKEEPYIEVSKRTKDEDQKLDDGFVKVKNMKKRFRDSPPTRQSATTRHSSSFYVTIIHVISLVIRLLIVKPKQGEMAMIILAIKFIIRLMIVELRQGEMVI